MRTRPPGMGDEIVVDALRRGWGLEMATVCYAPVGFGSHHWTATSVEGDRYFVTVDVFDHAEVDHAANVVILDAALRSARAVADRLPETVGPISTADGAVLVDLGSAAVSLFPALRLLAPMDLSSKDLSSKELPSKDHPAVTELLGRLHGLTALVAGTARRDRLSIRRRDQLQRALVHGVPDRRAGPFTRSLVRDLAGHADQVRVGLRRYDALAERAAGHVEDWVITHGEPHPGNLLTTADGLRLVDWDSALIAPAARDLADFGPEAVQRYVTSTGREVHTEELGLYRLRWELDEIAEYVAWFSRPHDHDADTRTAWDALTTAFAKLISLNASADLDRPA